MKTLFFDTLPSTSSYLKENQASFPSFTFVSSSFQTCGRGREDRKWLSSKGENLLFSFLLKEDGLSEAFPLLSLGCAASVYSSLESTGIKGLSIKWPNDVYVNDKKICGILLEGKLPDYLIVGIGINVNQSSFPGEYRIAPTSLALELDRNIDLEGLKQLVFSNLEKDVQAILKGDTSCIKIVREHNYLLNKEREFVLNGKKAKGVVLGIEGNGNLLFSYQGKTLSLSSGEIN